MRKVIVTEYVSLDGVMEDPAGSEGSGLKAWTFQFNRGPEGDKFKVDEGLASGALLLGRLTYQGFAEAWPFMTGEVADKLNSMPKFVVSTTLKEAEWNNSRIIKRNVAEEVSKLKQQPGADILVYGSGQLVNALAPHDLIDEYRLLVYPVVLGSGKRLFRDGNSATLRLVETKMFGSGIVLLRYQPDRKEP